MMIINPYWFIPSTPLLLNTYPTTGLAYSLRKLSNTYSGSAIRVRRSNDNTETDIGFVNNDLDLVSLSGFVGNNNAFVTTWYDQSGNNRNATQITASLQPRIMLSGVTETNVNGKPAIRIIDTSTVVSQNWLVVPLWHANTDTWVGLFTTYQLNTDGFYPYVQGSNNSDRGFLSLHLTSSRQIRGGTLRTGGYSLYDGVAFNLNQLYLRHDLANRTNLQTYLNGSSTPVINVADRNENFSMPTVSYLLGHGNNNSLLADMSFSEFIAYNLNQSSNKIGIETNITNYWLPLFLDVYSNAAGAYSIRKLRSAYSGSALRVRRSSDNTETNIGFINNELDTTTLLNFVGGSDGFVTTFYDQSGNGNNLIQTTAARQPQIVSSGTLLTLNGKPSLRTQTVLQGFVSTNNFTFTQSYIATVFNRTGRIGVGDTLYILDGSPYHQLYSTTSNWSYFYGSAFNTTISLSTSQKLLSHNYNGTTHFFYNNSTLDSQVNAAITITNLQLQVMATFTFNYGTQGNLQEFIIYTTNKTSDRAAIETNIKNYYGI